MNDNLFKGIVAGSLAYQNAQLGSISRGLAQIDLQLSGISQQVGTIAAEMVTARKAQQEAAFWKDKVFLIRKSMESAKAALPREARQAFFLSTGVLRYFQSRNVNSSTYSDIRDKEYFYETIELVKAVREKARPSLGAGDAESLEYLAYAVDVQAPLIELITWQRAKKILTPFIEQRDRWRGEVHKLREMNGCFGALLGLSLIAGVIALMMSSYFAAFWGVGALIAFGYWVKRRSKETTPPEFPVQANEELARIDLKAGYDIDPKWLDSQIDRVQAFLSQLGYANRHNEEEKTLSEAEEQIQAWQGEVVLG